MRSGFRLSPLGIMPNFPDSAIAFYFFINLFSSILNPITSWALGHQLGDPSLGIPDKGGDKEVITLTASKDEGEIMGS